MMNELIGAAILILFGLSAVAGAFAFARFRVPFGLVALLAFLGAGGLIHIVLAGSVVLVDRSGRVAEAALVNAGGARAMYRGPFGLFYGEPHGDAGIRLTCRDGRTLVFGYATPGMPIFQRLTPPSAC
jgi:hypothetical protein